MPKGNIMIVDDDPLMVALLVERLEESGYAVTAAYDANEALTQAEGLKPRLIISDMQMPVWGFGSDVLAHVRKHPVLHDVPMIFVTGMAHEKIKELYPSLIKDPKVRLLGKPVDWVMLEQALFELLGEERPLKA